MLTNGGRGVKKVCNTYTTTSLTNIILKKGTLWLKQKHGLAKKERILKVV